MKLEIYGNALSEEKVARLALELVGREVIALVAVDKNGDIRAGGHLLLVSPRGKISRCAGVNPHLGFVRDHLGRVELEEED